MASPAGIRGGLLTLCMLWAAVAMAAAPLAGRTVQEALRELSAGKVNFIYNDAILPPSLRVSAEPAAGTPEAMASEVLAAHGLALAPVGPGAFAIVKASAAEAAGSIAGRVLDRGGAALAGARVTVEGLEPDAVTDASGTFRIAPVASGRYRLSVAAEDYLPGAARAVRVRPGRATAVTIRLTSSVPTVAELVVTTSRYGLGHAQPQSHTFLTQADVQALPKLADEPLRSVQRLPGSASAGISAQTHIRGGEFDEVLLVLDGLPLTEPFHLKNFLAPVSVFDAAAIESLDVSSGGFTANHGWRMSGVIDITSLAPPAERYTELGLSLFHASALSAGRFASDRGGWLAAVRRSNLDLIAKAADSEVGEPEYFDAFGRVEYALSDVTKLFGSALTSHDELRANNKSRTQFADASYRNTYAWGGWEQQWPMNFSTRLTLALTDLETNRTGRVDDPGRRTGALSDDRSTRLTVGRLDATHTLDRLYTRFGVELREVEARYEYRSSVTFEPDYPFPGDPGRTIDRDLRPQPEGHQTAVYITSRARLTDRFTAELGLRWDGQTYDDIDATDQWAPRVNLMYDLAPGSRLRAAWGRFWQAQGANELQVEDGIARFYDPQHADHLIVSFEQALPRDLDLRIELYQKDYDTVRPHFENLFDPVRLLPELEPDRVEVAPENSQARGAEILLSRQAGDPWSWWLSYAWSRVTDRIEGRDVPRSWDQRHGVNAGLRYAGPVWEVTFADTYHTGWPTTQLTLAPDPGGGADVVTVGPRNAAQLSDYNSLDVRVMRRFDLPESTLEAFFEVTNLLVRDNECCVEYQVRDVGGNLAVKTDVDHWPGLIPSLGVVWKF